MSKVPVLRAPKSIDAPSDLPANIYALVEAAAKRCGSDGTAQFSRGGFLQKYDFNEDGIQDYIVDSSYFRCMPDSHLIYGGTAGTHYAFFISQEDRFIGKGYQ